VLHADAKESVKALDTSDVSERAGDVPAPLGQAPVKQFSADRPKLSDSEREKRRQSLAALLTALRAIPAGDGQLERLANDASKPERTAELIALIRSAEDLEEASERLLQVAGPEDRVVFNDIAVGLRKARKRFSAGRGGADKTPKLGGRESATEPRLGPPPNASAAAPDQGGMAAAKPQALPFPKPGSTAAKAIPVLRQALEKTDDQPSLSEIAVLPDAAAPPPATTKEKLQNGTKAPEPPVLRNALYAEEQIDAEAREPDPVEDQGATEESDAPIAAEQKELPASFVEEARAHFNSQELLVSVRMAQIATKLDAIDSRLSSLRVGQERQMAKSGHRTALLATLSTLSVILLLVLLVASLGA